MKKMVALACVLSSSLTLANPVNLYRGFSPGASDHFYTTDLGEMFYAASIGYAYEGVAGKCFSTQAPGTTPLYRLWVPGAVSDHFYTTSKPERDGAVAYYGYHDEGVACYVYSQPHSGTCPFYRLWNGTDHFYTQSWQEALNAVHSYGYGYENIAGYLLPANGACPH